MTFDVNSPVKSCNCLLRLPRVESGVGRAERRYSQAELEGGGAVRDGSGGMAGRLAGGGVGPGGMQQHMEYGYPRRPGVDGDMRGGMMMPGKPREAMQWVGSLQGYDHEANTATGQIEGRALGLQPLLSKDRTSPHPQPSHQKHTLAHCTHARLLEEVVRVGTGTCDVGWLLCSFKWIEFPQTWILCTTSLNGHARRTVWRGPEPTHASRRQHAMHCLYPLLRGQGAF